MKKYYLLITSVLLSFILYAVFYSGLLPSSLLGEITGSKNLFYDPVCTSSYYCRNLGYPFLQNIFLVFKANGVVFIFAQVLLFSFSCIFLTTEFYKLTKNKLLSYLLFFSIFFNPKVFKYSFAITEEGVFLSLIAISLALIIRFSRKLDLKTITILSFVIGVSITVRPAAYAMLPLLIIILFVYWQLLKKNLIKNILALFIPIALLISAESYLYRSNNNQDRETTAGVMLLGKTPLIAIKKVKNSKYPKLSNIIYDRGVLVRKIINDVDDFSLQQYLTNVLNINYHDLGDLYKPIKTQITNYKKEFGSRDAVTTGVFKEYAKENPLTTIKVIALNFIGLWQLSEILTPIQREDLSKLFEKKLIVDEYHKKRIYYHFKVIKNHAVFAQVAKIVLLILLLATIYLFIIGISALFKSIKNKQIIQPINFVSFILPIMLNGYFLLIAIMIQVQMRFILTYWSVLMTILFLSICLLSRKVKKNATIT